MSKGNLPQNFQDWEPVVLKKTKTDMSLAEKKSKGLVTTVRSADGGNNSNKQNVTIKYDEEGNETVKVQAPSMDMGKLIQSTRNEKKMTRKELASLCNIRESELGDYETGKVAIPGNHKSIIARRLGLTSLKKKSDDNK